MKPNETKFLNIEGLMSINNFIQMISEHEAPVMAILQTFIISLICSISITTALSIFIYNRNISLWQR